MLDQVDKENNSQFSNLHGSFRPFQADSKNPTGKSRKGVFGQLLAESNQEIVRERDEKLALRVQESETIDVAMSWIQEAKDQTVAENLRDEMKKEMDREKARELALSESQAVRFALEERKRIQREAQEKREREEKDSVYCKEVQSQMECEELRLRKEKESKDSDMANRVYLEEWELVMREKAGRREMERRDAEVCRKAILDDLDADFKASEARERTAKEDQQYAEEVERMLRDEAYAEEMACREREEDLNIRYLQQCIVDADEAIARAEEERLRQREEAERQGREEGDREEAERAQQALDSEEKMDRMRREREERVLSRKAVVRAAREEHRRIKRVELIRSPLFLPYPSLAQVAQLWLEADPEVENVAGGICLSLRLPFLEGVEVDCSDGKCVQVKGRRMRSKAEVEGEERGGGAVPASDSKDASSSSYLSSESLAGSRRYEGEFFIDGSSVSILPSDLSFDYSSETGLLHVYVDRVCLHNPSSPCVLSPSHSESKDSSPSNSTISRLSSSSSSSSLAKGLVRGRGQVVARCTLSALDTLSSGFKKFIQKR